MRPSPLVTTLLAVVGLHLAAARVCAQGPSRAAGAVAPDARIATIDSMARAAVRELPLAGLSIAIARGPQLLLARGYGYADLENEVPASERTVYRIGSITKQFTAAAILKLAEEGRLRLDDDITRYLPAYPMQGRRVTVRHLLNHTSGIRSFTEVPAFGPQARRDLSDTELLALIRKEPFEFEPGTNFLYNNSGFYLLAMVIEAVTGRSHGDYVGEAILAPLGLEDTRACEDRPLIRRRARGYDVGEGGLSNARYISMNPPKGGGNLCSTVLDLVKWVRAGATGAGLGADSYRLMRTPATLSTGEEVAYGAGLFLSRFGEREEISHGGGISGFSSFLAYYPADSLTVVVLSNTAADLWDGELARSLARPLLALRDGRRVKPTGAAVEIERVVGEYRLGSVRMIVSRAGDRLLMEAADALQLPERAFYLPRGGGRFVAVQDPELQLRFQKEANGANRLIIAQAGRFYGAAVRAP